MTAPKPPQFLSLTLREKRVCKMLAEGLSVSEVAKATESTAQAVSKVIARACQREGCKSTLHLVVRYLHEYCGVLDPVE